MVRKIESYYEVDKDGYIKNSFKLDTATEKIPSHLIKKWEGDICSPRYVKEVGEWIDMAREWEKKGFKTFELYKQSKDKELNKACELAILSGFYHTVGGYKYLFSYDKESQVNLQETYQLLQNNAMKNVMWTAKIHDGKVRIPMDKESFNELYYTSVRHKLSNISYYRDILSVELGKAVTVKQVDSINFNKNITNDIDIQLNSEYTMDKRIEQGVVYQSQGDSELLDVIMMMMMG